MISLKKGREDKWCRVLIENDLVEKAKKSAERQGCTVGEPVPAEQMREDMHLATAPSNCSCIEIVYPQGKSILDILCGIPVRAIL